MLNEITNGEFDLKNINPENYKIQSKSFIAYTNIMNKLKIRNTEFHTYKPTQERSLKILRPWINSRCVTTDDVTRTAYV